MLDRMAQWRVTRRWARAARRISDLTDDDLRNLRGPARTLRHQIDRFLYRAEHRLALPDLNATQFPKPHDADWAWRPEFWHTELDEPGLSSVATQSKFGRELTLFHDCAFSELTLRQVRNLREEDLAAFGLHLDVFRFDGTFLSIVVDLPKTATEGLTKDHLLRLDALIDMERPLEIFGRLNIKHGPNTEQIVRELPLDGDKICIEFDLAYSNLNEKRLEKAWVDLIFEGPQMNHVVVRDLTFFRRPRAAL